MSVFRSKAKKAKKRIVLPDTPAFNAYVSACAALIKTNSRSPLQKAKSDRMAVLRTLVAALVDEPKLSLATVLDVVGLLSYPDERACAAVSLLPRLESDALAQAEEASAWAPATTKLPAAVVSNLCAVCMCLREAEVSVFSVVARRTAHPTPQTVEANLEACRELADMSEELLTRMNAVFTGPSGEDSDMQLYFVYDDADHRDEVTGEFEALLLSVKEADAEVRSVLGHVTECCVEALRIAGTLRQMEPYQWLGNDDAPTDSKVATESLALALDATAVAVAAAAETIDSTASGPLADVSDAARSTVGRAVKLEKEFAKCAPRLKSDMKNAVTARREQAARRHMRRTGSHSDTSGTKGKF